MHYRKAPPEPDWSWLFTIARNLLIDSMRGGRVEDSARRKLRLEPLQRDDGDLARIEEITHASDLAVIVREALLRANYRIGPGGVVCDRCDRRAGNTISVFTGHVVRGTFARLSRTKLHYD